MNDQPNTRPKSDSMGEIAASADCCWGAQTQRSLQNLGIGGERMPVPLVRARGLVKQAAAETNMTLGLLDRKLGEAIAKAAAEVVAGTLDDHFPLVVRQTGSGTRTNMNANEVIAGRANELLAGKRSVDLGMPHPAVGDAAGPGTIRSGLKPGADLTIHR